MSRADSDGSAEGDRGRSNRRRSTSLRWIILAMVAVVLIGLGTALYVAIQGAREAALASVCHGPLNQMQVALANYHAYYGRFPPAYLADADGRPMHSWRVLILPYIEEQELYDAYNFDEPWNGLNNSKLADKMPRMFHMRSEPPSSSMTNVVAIVGPGTAFPGSKSTRMEDFTDGSGNTILLAEVADSNFHWLEPRDLHVDEMSFTVNDPSRPSISSSRRRGPYVVFADSIRVHWISPSLRPEMLKALTTIAGSEQLYIAEIDDVGLTSPAPGPATDAKLKQLRDSRKIGQLRRLWLNRSDVTDAAVEDLKDITSLEMLDLRDTKVSEAGVEILQKALPECEIHWSRSARPLPQLPTPDILP